VENNELDELGNEAVNAIEVVCHTLPHVWVVCGSVSLRYAMSHIRGIEELLKEAEDDSKPS